MSPSELPGLLRRIRRLADLSQRQLADRLGLSKSTIAAAESGSRDLSVGTLGTAAELAGLRLALADGTGHLVDSMAEDAVRDEGGRQYPAHLDTRHGDERWWHGAERYSRAQPWYTYDRVREARDLWRGQLGTPDDHQLPRAGDSPQERRAARRRAAFARREEERLLRWAADGRPAVPAWVCDCPPGCDPTREVTREVHVEDCPCRCDIA